MTMSPEIAARISALSPGRDPVQDSPDQAQVWTSGLVGAILDGTEDLAVREFIAEFDSLVDASDECRDAMPPSPREPVLSFA